LVLFAVFHYIPCQHLAGAFIVYFLKKIGYLVTFTLVFALVQFLLEFFKLLLPSSLVLCLAKVGEFQIEFSFKLILEYLCVFCLVDVLIHDIIDFHQLTLKVFDSGIVAGGIDDELKLFLGEDKFFLELLV
jgi:hypothetical protein